MEWYLKVLKNYVGFAGRARRKEYWMFTLINALIVFTLSVVDLTTDLYPLFTGLYYAAILLPALAVTVRRLHDTGKSGWWLLISLVPFVGYIILLLFVCTESQTNDTQFGPNPKNQFNAVS